MPRYIFLSGRSRALGGFTLIEILIVMAIIGVLASIAIPAFLGQRETAKQKTLEASARTALTEVQGALQDYGAKKAIVLLDSTANLRCYQHLSVSNTQRCSRVYPEINNTGSYSDWGSVVNLIITHHNDGKGEKNPFNGNSLFSGTIKRGAVSVLPIGDNKAQILAFTPSDVAVFNSVVVAF